MMKYISMDDIVDICQANIPPLKANRQGVAVSALRRVIEAVKEYAVEAESVKRGQWIYGENEDGQDGIFCSECGHFVPWYYDYYDKTDDLINDNPRCPHCGARMDGGAD